MLKIGIILMSLLLACTQPTKKNELSRKISGDREWTRATGNIGNGGYGVVCKNSNNNIVSVEMLDTFDTSVKFKTKYNSGLFSIKNFNASLNRLNFEKADEEIKYNIKEMFNRLVSLPSKIEINETSKDALPEFNKKGCEIEQIAKFNGDEQRLYVANEYYKHLNDFQKFVLFVHEGVYKFRRDNFDDIDSQKSRVITGIALADKSSLGEEARTIFSIYLKDNIVENLDPVPMIKTILPSVESLCFPADFSREYKVDLDPGACPLRIGALSTNKLIIRKVDPRCKDSGKIKFPSLLSFRCGNLANKETQCYSEQPLFTGIVELKKTSLGYCALLFKDSKNDQIQNSFLESDQELTINPETGKANNGIYYLVDVFNSDPLDLHINEYRRYSFSEKQELHDRYSEDTIIKLKKKCRDAGGESKKHSVWFADSNDLSYGEEGKLILSNVHVTLQCEVSDKTKENTAKAPISAPAIVESKKPSNTVSDKKIENNIPNNAGVNRTVTSPMSKYTNRDPPPRKASGQSDCNGRYGRCDPKPKK